VSSPHSVARWKAPTRNHLSVQAANANRFPGRVMVSGSSCDTAHPLSRARPFVGLALIEGNPFGTASIPMVSSEALRVSRPMGTSDDCHPSIHGTTPPQGPGYLGCMFAPCPGKPTAGGRRDPGRRRARDVIDSSPGCACLPPSKITKKQNDGALCSNLLFSDRVTPRGPTRPSSSSMSRTRHVRWLCG